MCLIIFLVVNSATVLSKFISAYAFQMLLCIFCIHKHIKVNSHDDYSPCLCNQERQHKAGTEKNYNDCIYIEVLGVPVPVV